MENTTDREQQWKNNEQKQANGEKLFMFLRIFNLTTHKNIIRTSFWTKLDETSNGSVAALRFVQGNAGVFAVEYTQNNISVRLAGRAW